MLSSDTIYIQDDIIPHIEQKDAPQVNFEPKTAPVESVEDLIRQEFPENPELMIKVAWCESRLYQDVTNNNFENGEIWSTDYGVFQINDYFHRETAESMGLDIEVLEDNIKYARYLYDQNKLQDWVASKPCWK